MATLIENTVPTTARQAPVSRQRPKAAGSPAGVLVPWLRAQSINVTRHAAALRPFSADEFGTGAEAPTAGHLQAVNQLMSTLRRSLLHMSSRVSKAAALTSQQPSTPRLQDLVRNKE